MISYVYIFVVVDCNGSDMKIIMMNCNRWPMDNVRHHAAEYVCIQYIISSRMCSLNNRWCGGLQIDESCCIVALQSIIKK